MELLDNTEEILTKWLFSGIWLIVCLSNYFFIGNKSAACNKGYKYKPIKRGCMYSYDHLIIL